MSNGDLPDRLARHFAASPAPISYAALAATLGLDGPGRIATLTLALEILMEREALAGRPFSAALAVSRVTGLPARGFFDKAAALGRYAGVADGPGAADFVLSERAALAAPALR